MSPDRPDAAVETLMERLRYGFSDPGLAELALSHPSFTHEIDGTRGNERLEFLGDAVLDLVIADLFFRAHPDWNEGDMTRARAALVNKRALAKEARELGLGELVKLGRTERRSGGERKESVLANCLEAVIGAVYLDGGIEPVTTWLVRIFGEVVTAADAPELRDVKTSFQEWAHANHQTTPHYRTVRDSGTDDDPERFTVEVLVGEEVFGTGVGRSKRLAEQAAAAAGAKRGSSSHG